MDNGDTDHDLFSHAANVTPTLRHFYFLMHYASFHGKDIPRIHIHLEIKYHIVKVIQRERSDAHIHRHNHHDSNHHSQYNPAVDILVHHKVIMVTNDYYT